MSDHFINLNCSNCGGKLNLYDDVERFACGYCGMIVQRRGGIIALTAVKEVIQRVQAGTDKTAARLALFRLRQDRSETIAQFSAIKPSVAMPWGCAIPVALTLVALGVWIGTAGSGLIGMIVITIGLVIPGINSGLKESEFSWRKAKAECDSKVRSIDQEITHQIEIVSR
jgi:hypothetical protein